jgi:hypothetical protein
MGLFVEGSTIYRWLPFLPGEAGCCLALKGLTRQKLTRQLHQASDQSTDSDHRLKASPQSVNSEHRPGSYRSNATSKAIHSFLPHHLVDTLDGSMMGLRGTLHLPTASRWNTASHWDTASTYDNRSTIHRSNCQTWVLLHSVVKDSQVGLEESESIPLRESVTRASGFRQGIRLDYDE